MKNSTKNKNIQKHCVMKNIKYRLKKNSSHAHPPL